MGRAKADPRARKRVGLHRRVRQAREAMGWGTDELASALGVNELTILRIEAGAVSVNEVRIVKLAEVLGTTAGRLLGESA